MCAYCGEKEWTSGLQFRHSSKKVKWFRYRPGVAQRVGTGIALLLHDRSTRRGLVVSSTPRPHFTPRKDPVPIIQKAGWAPGSVWTGGKSRPHRDLIPDRPAHSQSLYRLSYPVYKWEPWTKSNLYREIGRCRCRFSLQLFRLWIVFLLVVSTTTPSPYSNQRLRLWGCYGFEYFINLDSCLGGDAV